MRLHVEGVVEGLLHKCKVLEMAALLLILLMLFEHLLLVDEVLSVRSLVGVC